MRKGLVRLHLAMLVSLLGAPALALLPAQPVAAAPLGFVSSHFERKWVRTDQPVERQIVRRSWLWGDVPLTSQIEEYVQSPGGQRLVQYFDKSRMEINNPSTNFVTNGLLATELITGRLQTGDGEGERQIRQPAEVGVAGDPDDVSGPTYASFARLLKQPPLPVGTTVTETLGRAGQVGADAGKASYGVTATNLVRETNHTIASVFWTFLQTSGPVQVGAATPTEKVFEPWYDATGLPISRPYWARVKVAGEVKDVLVQAFERRVLTYTPSNPEGFRVEMGNVGRHYYKWRYGSEPALERAFRALKGPHIGYGFNGFFSFKPQTSLSDLQRSLDLVKGADFDWIRQQVVWASLEPSPGEYSAEQLAIYDAIIREAAQRRIRIMFSVTKAPRWAVAGDHACHGAPGQQLCGLPQDPRTLARLMSYLATRYRDPAPGKYASTVAAFEVWNEQNTGGETGNNIQVGAYIEVLKASYTAIKAVDPRYVVLYGGLTPTGVNDPRLAIDDVEYLRRSYQYNRGEMRRYFDVLGAHPGSNNNSPDQLWPDNPGPGTGCTPPTGKCWQDHASFYFRRIEQLRRVMEEFGDADKQMWLTEFGWTTRNQAPGYEYGSVISEELQARYLVRAFEKGQRDYYWMGVMFLWTLNHSVVVPPSDEKYPWSVLRGDWSPRPAYDALKAMPKPR